PTRVTVAAGRFYGRAARRCAPDRNPPLRRLLDDRATLALGLRLIGATFTTRPVTCRSERLARATLRSDEDVRRGTHGPADQYRLTDFGKLGGQIRMVRTESTGRALAMHVKLGFAAIEPMFLDLARVVRNVIKQREPCPRQNGV